MEKTTNSKFINTVRIEMVPGFAEEKMRLHGSIARCLLLSASRTDKQHIHLKPEKLERGVILEHTRNLHKIINVGLMDVM